MNDNKYLKKTQEKSKKSLYKPEETLFLRTGRGKIETRNIGYVTLQTTLHKRYYASSRSLDIEKLLLEFNGLGKHKIKTLLNNLIWSQIMFASISRKKSYSDRYNFSIYLSQSKMALFLGCTREWANKLIARLSEMGVISLYRRHKATSFYRVAPILFAGETLQKLSRVFTSLKKLLVTTFFGKKFTLIKLFKELLSNIYNIKLKRIQNTEDSNQDILKVDVSVENKDKLLTSIASLTKSMSLVGVKRMCTKRTGTKRTEFHKRENTNPSFVRNAHSYRFNKKNSYEPTACKSAAHKLFVKKKPQEDVASEEEKDIIIKKLYKKLGW